MQTWRDVGIVLGDGQDEKMNLREADRFFFCHCPSFAAIRQLVARSADVRCIVMKPIAHTFLGFCKCLLLIA
jgi:hypothetical protein